MDTDVGGSESIDGSNGRGEGYNEMEGRRIRTVRSSKDRILGMLAAVRFRSTSSASIFLMVSSASAI
jgi:hypothetical protein